MVPFFNIFLPDLEKEEKTANKMRNAMIEIRTLRHGLWTHVASRKHAPTKVFFGADDEVMLYGAVTYVLRADPEEVEVPWAGRVGFVVKGDEVRMRFYQVYLVCYFFLWGEGLDWELMVIL